MNWFRKKSLDDLGFRMYENFISKAEAGKHFKCTKSGTGPYKDLHSFEYEKFKDVLYIF